MKKINLKGITESLSDSEMKQVKGGSQGMAGGGMDERLIDLDLPKDTANSSCNKYPSCGPQCEGKKIGDLCDNSRGICKCWPDPLRYSYCKICYH